MEEEEEEENNNDELIGFFNVDIENNNNDNVEESEPKCEEYDHTEFTQHLGTEFYIPECTELFNVKVSTKQVQGWFLVKDAYYDEVREEYINFIGPQNIRSSYAEDNIIIDLEGDVIIGTLKDGVDVFISLHAYDRDDTIMIVIYGES